MEEELWVHAACQVLSRAKKPMHYTDIKSTTLEAGLIPAGMKTTLEMALFKESQKPMKRVFVVDGRPGVFALSSSASQEVEVEEKASSSLLLSQQNGVTPKSDRDRYYTKYRRLKRLVKQTVFLNSAMCDEVARIEEKVTRVKEERKYFLRRLLQMQSISDASQQGTLSNTPSHHPAAASTASLNTRPSTQSVAQLLGEAEKRKKKNGSTLTVPCPSGVTLPTAASIKTNEASMTQKGKKKAVKDTVKAVTPPSTDTKPKGKKGKATKRFVTPIPLDNTGRPIFPIELNTLTVYCLGEIIPKSGYYTTDCIYPVGFCSTREYVSLHEPTDKCLYTCKVIDGENGAQFELSAEDYPEQVIAGNSPDVCHYKLINSINAAIGEEVIPGNIRGAEFFGLCHPTIQNLIQYCPGAKKCQGYRWGKFEIAKDGAPHVEDESTVNVDIIMSSPIYKSGLTNILSRQSEGSGSLRNLLTNRL